MSRAKIDVVDLTILATLQDQGRITNVDLAEKAGITAPPCLRRLRSLETEGFIKGYHAELDHQQLGFNITVFAMVGLHSQAEADLIAFEELAKGWPLVRECHMLNGEIDFILKIVAQDLDEFQKFLTSQLTQAPNVDSVKTSFTIRTAKMAPGVPLEMLLNNQGA